MLGDRIKELRKNLGLTQQKFAERIGIKQNTIAAAESNKRTLSRQALMSISREFGASLQWLETGEGEMYTGADTSILAELEAKGKLTSKGRELLEIYLRMPPATQDLIASAIEAAVKYFPRPEEGLTKAEVYAEMGVAVAAECKPDSEKTCEEAHEQIDAEFEARRRRNAGGILTSSASTGTNGLSKKFGNSS